MKNKTNIMEDNTGIAYGIGALIVFLILSSLFYITFSEFINGVIGVYNTKMLPDVVSTERAGSMSYLVNMWLAVPFFILIAGVAWGVVRALEQRGDVM